MTLKVLVGRAGTGKTATCLANIRQQLRRSVEGNSLVLILPEHATFKTEQLLAATLELGGFTRSYVFGFKRLAQRILMETGGGLRPRINDVGKRLLLAKILHKQGKILKVLGRAARQRNFTESLAAMIEEFKSYAVTPDELVKTAAGLDDSLLKDKLQDLALVYQEFVALMQNHYTDAEDSLDFMAKRLKDSAIMQQAQVWVDGFVFFNPQELAILREILQTAQSVTVTLCLTAPDSSEHAVETALFHRQWKTLQQLKKLAAELSIAVEVTECDEQQRFRQRSLQHLADNLYRFPAPYLAQAAGVQIVEAANRRLEAEGVAVDILRLCREANYRWRDIGILVRDDENYRELLTAVLVDYEIPVFSDVKRLSIHHPLAELLRSAVEAVNAWKYEPLFRCFKTDFFPVAREQIDLLENYVLEFGIQGQRWTMDADWTYYKHLALDEDSEIDAVGTMKLQEINAIRRALITPLQTFAVRFKLASDVNAQTTALYELLVDLKVPQQLEQWATAAEQRGDLDEAREHQQLWDNIILFMDQLSQTCGTEKLTLRDYEALLSDALAGLTLSLIPPGLDYVTMAAFAQNSLENIKAIYIVGANEGVLPQRSRGEGLLTDAERLQMAIWGIDLAAGSGADNFAERFLIYSAFTRSTEYLWVSYPLADSEGSGLLPSPLIARIREIMDTGELRAILLENSLDADKWQIAHPRRAIANLAGALQTRQQKSPVAKIWHDVYNWALTQEKLRDILHTALAGLWQRGKVMPLPPELAGKLYTKNRCLKGSVTRFERFRACPFQHFAQYGLRLKERAEYRFAAPDLGQFLHAALKKFGDMMHSAGRDWSDVAVMESQELCQNIVDSLAPKLQNEILLSSAQHQHLLGRISKMVQRSIERLIAFDSVSAFKPVSLEKSFGQGKNALPPLTYLLGGGYKLEINGQIDRIDQLEYANKQYFLVIDYKSGNAYVNLIDVYYGLRMQLLTYLLVVQNSARQKLGQPVIPAGVLYYFLKNPVVSENHKITETEALAKLDAMLRMPGWVIADVEMIRQIDSSLKFLKVAITTKATIHAASKNSVKTPEEFAALLNHVDCILADTGREILQGNIQISPYELDNRQACTYCPYRSFCQFDSLLPEYQYRKLKKFDNASLLDEMQAVNKA